MTIEPTVTRRWTALWGPPHPCVHPLATLAGTVVTAEAPADHPWHHALWFTIKFVNGENFWEEFGEFGTQHTRSVVSAGGDTTAEIDWVRPDGVSVAMHETRVLRSVAVDELRYALDFDIVLRPAAATLLDRTPFTTWGGYGGLTLRGAADWTDTRLLLAGGAARERSLGERSPWCAIDGTGGRGAPAGVAIFDHPGNARFPTPWYASTRAETYGSGWANFVNAALLWDEPLAFDPGAPLRLRYRVVVGDCSWDAGEVGTLYAAWAG